MAPSASPTYVKARLDEATRLNKAENVQNYPKIQKVQPHIRKCEGFSRHFSPRLVSVGPISHGDTDRQGNLELGEHYKFLWAAKYLEETNQTAQQLVDKIVANMPRLKGLYAEDVMKGCCNDVDVAWTFLVDGCAVLHFMEKASPTSPQDLKIKIDQLVIVQQDLLLLENQLPFPLLKLLSNDDLVKLESSVENFFKMHHMVPKQKERHVKLRNENSTTGSGSGIQNSPKPDEIIIIVNEDQPIHLLDLLRKAILGGDPKKLLEERQSHTDKKTRPNHPEGKVPREKTQNFGWPTHRNIQELKTSGIRVKKHNGNAKFLTDIAFTMPFHFCGRLHLSELVVDDSTASSFLNLIAYEMCPDFENDYKISSYVAFLDSLIDHSDDVKELRKAGILHNALGSDDEVTMLFNSISTDLVPDPRIYAYERWAIEKHCRTTYKTLIVQAYYEYFHNPWAFIGFLAASIALFLTFAQTWLAMYPPKDNSK